MTQAAAARTSPRFTPAYLLRLLLVFVPLAAVAEWAHWSPLAVFACAGIAIIPLAGIMGETTERLAERLGAGLGGLLNATFGNAAELIIALVALHNGLYDVVKASLPGSIIGNVLLVLGPATPAASPARAALTLLVATAGVAWMSELLVGAVAEASHVLGLTPVFVGVIVVAIIGNAAEHSTAILVAIKDQMDLAMNIAISSSIQIALFVAPVLVFASFFMPHGPMDLIFTIFEVLAVTVAVAVMTLIALDGESNWLEGALMLAVYLILGIAFYFLP